MIIRLTTFALVLWMAVNPIVSWWQQDSLQIAGAHRSGKPATTVSKIATKYPKFFDVSKFILCKTSKLTDLRCRDCAGIFAFKTCFSCENEVKFRTFVRVPGQLDPPYQSVALSFSCAAPEVSITVSSFQIGCCTWKIHDTIHIIMIKVIKKKMVETFGDQYAAARAKESK